MPLPVVLTQDAEYDLEDIVVHIIRHDSAARATRVLERIHEAIGKLAEHPSRGVFPLELVEIEVREYREVFFKPYRVIYRVFEDRVVVVMVSDGRRDMKSLLLRRLLEA